MGIWGSSGAEGMAGGQAEGRREEDSLIWRQTLKGRQSGASRASQMPFHACKTSCPDRPIHPLKAVAT